jgi:hypothetical protein
MVFWPTFLCSRSIRAWRTLRADEPLLQRADWSDDLGSDAGRWDAFSEALTGDARRQLGPAGGIAAKP